MRIILLLFLSFSSYSMVAQTKTDWNFKSKDSIEITEKKYYQYLKDPNVSRGKLLAEAWHSFHYKVKGTSKENSFMKGKLQEMLNHNMHDYLDFVNSLYYTHTDFMMKLLEPGQLDVFRELYLKNLYNKTIVPANLPANGEGWLAYKKRNKNAPLVSKPSQTKKPVGYSRTKKAVPAKSKKRHTCYACDNRGKIKRRVWVIKRRERRAGNMGYGKSVVVETSYAEYMRGAPKPSVGGNTTATVEDVMLICPKCDGKKYYLSE